MSTTLSEIKAPISSVMDEFEKKFRSSMKSSVPLLDRITHYIVKRKGKQMRPMFVFLSAGLCGGINERTHRAATLIELLHTATLVHDDVVDDSNERRGFFSINALWKNKIAVLVGDYLLSKGLLLSVQHEDYDLLKIVSEAVRVMSEGELMQIEKARRLDISEEIYFEIIRQKTASLIASCCAAGAASAGSQEITVNNMHQFGELIGIAFQIKDDLFDYGPSGIIGKPTGIDIKESKMTLPLIYSLSKAGSADRKRIVNIIRNENTNQKKVNEVIQFVKDSGGLEYATQKMNQYQSKAMAMIEDLPESTFKKSLTQLIRFTIEKSLKMIGRTFYFISSILVLAGAFILLSPSLLTPELIYPERIDSTYIAYHASLDGTETDSLIFTPSDVGLKYSDMSIVTTDGIKLNGWYVSAEDKVANTILIIHDLNESKILYIDHMKQFHDRGLNVCVFDLRAHGNSGGNEFTPGLPSVDDTRIIIDSILAKKETRHLAIMGVGVGTAIAMQVAVYDSVCQALVLQNAIDRYEDYIARYSHEKWGIMNSIWYPVLKRRVESLLHYPIKQLDLSEIASYTSIPALYIIGSDNEKITKSETLRVFDATITEKKELFLVENAGNQNITKAGGESYYNRIAAFLISNLPKEIKTTRYKKLALNDY